MENNQINSNDENDTNNIETNNNENYTPRSRTASNSPKQKFNLPKISRNIIIVVILLLLALFIFR